MAGAEQHNASERVYLTLIAYANEAKEVRGLRYDDIRSVAQVSLSDLNLALRDAKANGLVTVEKDERNWNVYALHFEIDEVLAARARSFVKARVEVIRADEAAERDRQLIAAAQLEAENARRRAVAAAAQHEYEERQARYETAARDFNAKANLSITNFEIYDRHGSALKATFDLKVPHVGTFVRCTFMWPDTKERGWVNGPSVQNRQGEYQKAGYLEKDLSAQLLELCEFVLYGPSLETLVPIPLADPV